MYPAFKGLRIRYRTISLQNFIDPCSGLLVSTLFLWALTVFVAIHRSRLVLDASIARDSNLVNWHRGSLVQYFGVERDSNAAKIYLD
jgi:hypothetical protein